MSVYEEFINEEQDPMTRVHTDCTTAHINNAFATAYIGNCHAGRSGPCKAQDD